MTALIHWLEQHMLSCPYKSLTGWDCPGCGMQRAFIALLEGNIGKSLHLYPALLPVLFTLLLTAVHVLFKLRNGAAWVKYSYLATMGIIIFSYILKMTT